MAEHLLWPMTSLEKSSLWTLEYYYYNISRRLFTASGKRSSGSSASKNNIKNRIFLYILKTLRYRVNVSNGKVPSFDPFAKSLYIYKRKRKSKIFSVDSNEPEFLGRLWKGVGKLSQVPNEQQFPTNSTSTQCPGSMSSTSLPAACIPKGFSGFSKPRKHMIC
jgi:hypothetical protein